MSKILVVDDDKITVKACNKNLGKLGYDIHAAMCGQEAIDFISAGNPVDLILLDQMMPDMDGLETFYRIKKSRPHIPVIMVTGCSSMNLSIHFMKSGGMDFVVKPFDFAILDIKIRQAIENKDLERKIRDMEIEKKAAIEVEKMKNTILAFITHDLLTPLEDIQHHLDSLQQMVVKIPPERRKMADRLGQIAEAGDRLNASIDDLLEVALIEKGIVADYTRVNLNQIIVSILDDIKTHHNDMCLQFDFHIALEENLPACWADEVKLRKVIFNMITNSFVNKDPKEIFFRTWSWDKEIIFSICSRNMIFFKELKDLNFEQPENRPHFYSGFRFWMGLSIADKLAELMNCRIWLERFITHESTIYLSVPPAD